MRQCQFTGPHTVITITVGLLAHIKSGLFVFTKQNKDILQYCISRAYVVITSNPSSSLFIVTARIFDFYV